MSPNELDARDREQAFADALRTITPIPELTPLANQARVLFLIDKQRQLKAEEEMP